MARSSIVNEIQEAIFFKGGRALDLFGPGRHTLTSGNLPLLCGLLNLPFGGKTPFTTEVWFINKHVKRDIQWGTRSPIPLVDPVYGYPVSVRAYGQWGIRVLDLRRLVLQLVGTLPDLRSEKVNDYFSGEIVQRFSDALAKFFVERRGSIFDANAKLNELSQFTIDAIQAEFNRFGLEVVNFNVGRISLPEEELKKFQEVLGKKMEIDQIGGSQVGQAYTVSRAFDVLDKAASAEGGTAGALLAGGIGLGAGLSAGVPIGQQLDRAMSSAAKADPTVRLHKLKELLENGLISQEDFEMRKRQILSDI